MSDLPESWVEVPIGSVARIVGGGTPPSKDPQNFVEPGKGIPWVTPADLSGYRKQSIERGARDLTEAGYSACGATLMPQGTVLFSSRAPIGYVAIAANEISTNQGFKSFVLPPEVDARYTYYQLKWLKPEAEAIATGTTFKELSGAATATLPFKLAPAAEQTRIANQLDTLLTRIQSCNDRFDAIPALLKRFRQAVLVAATSGQLTADWRAREMYGVRQPSKTKQENKNLPQRWEWHSLRDLVDCFDKLRVPIKASDRAKRQGVFNYYGAFGVIDSIDSFLFEGEYLLIAEDGKNLESRERPIALVAKGKFWVNNHAHVVRPKSNLNIRFLLHWLNSPSFDISDLLTGIDQIKLTRGAMDRIPVPLPPLNEQAEIVRRVEIFFALADRIEARATAARTQAQRLSSLVLSKAFRGELVQQDPQDEPASVLLQRLAATKYAKAKASRGRPRAKTQDLFATPEGVQPDAAGLPDGAWAAPDVVDEHAVTTMLVAVLKAWGGPMPQMQARLAAVLCLQPRQMAVALPADPAAQWQRLVGPAADPLPTQVARLQPATDSGWRKALRGMRARGDLVEEGSGPQATWVLGSGAGQIETAGWPEGRAGWVVAYVRAHGAEAILPLLEPLTVEFVHARAA